MNEITVIGLMSGTSLDGLDIAACRFRKTSEEWRFGLDDAITVPYPTALVRELEEAHKLDAYSLGLLHGNLGNFFGQQTLIFIRDTGTNAAFISSHGHTVFHRPELGITLQIGDPRHIASICSLPVIADFRRQDLELGGQGAPFVPVGDHYLFPEYDLCLNLGGIANVSFIKNGKRAAFDCCPFNQVFNKLASLEGKPYDDRGMMSRSGHTIAHILKALNSLGFYRINGPRSLGREWVESEFMPLLGDPGKQKTVDLLATCTQHFAEVVAAIIKESGKKGKMLVSGGGAYHTFFIEQLRKLTDVKIVIADDRITRFREALVFAFLGLLQTRGEHNVFASVTGARQDHCAGFRFDPE